MVWPAIIAAGASLAGGSMSNDANSKMSMRQARLQKEFAQHGIRWRVADAKAAGLHPLYALGAQLPTYQPSFAMDSMGPALAQAGQDIGRAMAAQETQEERNARALAGKLLESQIRETDARAGLARAETLNVLRGAGNPFPEVNMPESKLIGDSASTSGGAELIPSKVTMSRPTDSGIVAGPANPAMREFVLPGGFKMMLPDASSLGEALESVSESAILAWGIYKENSRLYGPEWEKQFKRRYGVDWIMKLQDMIGRSQDRIRNAPFKRNTGKGNFLPPRSGR